LIEAEKVFGLLPPLSVGFPLLISRKFLPFLNFHLNEFQALHTWCSRTFVLFLRVFVLSQTFRFAARSRSTGRRSHNCSAVTRY